MMDFLRSILRPEPPAPPPPADDGRLRQLEERLAEMDRHRWELQHRINLLRDDFDRVMAGNADAARVACRAELDAFRRDFEPALKDIYGTLGAGFRRVRVPSAPGSLAERFGEAESRRGDDS